MSLTHEEFIELYADDPDWVERRESPYFEIDLRRALEGDAAGFRELAVYGVEDQTSPRIMKALWKAGAPVRPHRNTIKRRWRVQSTFFIAAFGENLDAFLREVGFDTARLPEEFDVWRGGDDSADVMAHGRSWTLSYSVACSFALHRKLWRDLRGERWARELGYPEPLVLTRRIRRDQAVAWIGGLEREVVLAKEAIGMPARTSGSLRDWRRHRARRHEYIFG